MAGFSSTARQVLPKPPKVSGYFNAAGKPTFVNSPKVKGLAPTPSGGYPVSGYFNSSGQPTFANSPQVKGLAQTSSGVAPPAPPRPPAPAGQAPGAGAAGEQLPVLDATALNNIATNQFGVNNRVNALNTNLSNLRTGLQSALGQLAYQQPRDELRAEQNANNRGALYSSVYNQALGDLIHQYATKQNTLTANEGQQEGSIAAQIRALQGGIPLYNQGQANASVARAIQAAAANPATGQLTPQQVAYINAGLKKAPAAKPQREIQSGRGWKAVR